MVFQAKIKWYDECEGIERKETCIIYSSPDFVKNYIFSDVVHQLENYYGKDLCHISEIKIISDDNFIITNGHKDIIDEGNIVDKGDIV